MVTKPDYIQIEAHIMIKWLEECSTFMKEGYSLHKPDVLDKAVAIITIFQIKNHEMEKALYRAKDELEGWFGNDPKESLDSVVEVTQTKTIEDTLKEIKEALA